LIERSVAANGDFGNVEEVIVDRGPKSKNEIQTKYAEEKTVVVKSPMRSVRYPSCPPKGNELVERLKGRSWSGLDKSKSNRKAKPGKVTKRSIPPTIYQISTRFQGFLVELGS